MIRCAVALAALGCLAVTGAGCDGPGRLRADWVAQGDQVLRETVEAGRLEDRALREASGLTASRSEPGVFWLLNDSGNDERLFAVDGTGRSHGTVRVHGTRNQDWEALASGPCPEGWCLYIGDVGDNGARRSAVRLWRLPEPRTTDTAAFAPELLTVRYADGPHDVEAMYVAPDTSVWLITKRPASGVGGEHRPVRAYRVAPDAWKTRMDTVTVPVADSLPVVPRRGTSRDWVTDASLSAPDTLGRRRLVLLSYGAVHVFAADPLSGRPGALEARCALPIRERRSEGVTWRPDGRILLVNEGRGGAMYTGACP